MSSPAAESHSGLAGDQSSELSKHGLKEVEAKCLGWQDDTPQFPRNWPRRKKLYNTIFITWLEFLMTLISTSGTAAADAAREKDFTAGQTTSYFLFVSLYLIGQTIGGIAVSPFSETFGRRELYIFACLVFAGLSAITAAVPSIIAVGIARFFAGFVSAIPATVAFGNFDDTYDAKVRVWVVYWYTTFGNAGLVLGPIFAAYLIATIGWKWIFYISTFLNGASAVAAVFLYESRATALLRKRVKKIQQSTGDFDLKPAATEHRVTFQEFLTNSLYRPLLFLVTEPLVMACAAICAIAYALIYGLTEAITIVYTQPSFPFTETTSSLAFIALLIGLMLNVLPRIYDQNLLNTLRRQNKEITAETKIQSFATACPALALGLWIFAWSVPPHVHTHWIVSMIGLVFIGYATNDIPCVLFSYMTDSYGEYSASAVSALSMFRTTMAAVFPLFTTQMYQGLDPNIATTLLAAIATVFAFVPFIFLRKGRQLREKSRYASKEALDGSSSCSEGDETSGETKG